LEADPNTETTINGKNTTPLVFAISSSLYQKDKESIEIIKILLEAGANPNHKTLISFMGDDMDHYFYPLFLSILLFCPLSVVELLIEYGVNVNQINNMGNGNKETALDACYYGFGRNLDDDAKRMLIESVINYLKTKGAKTIKELKGNKTNNTE
jgi:ankyrin repeat protein